MLHNHPTRTLLVALAAFLLLAVIVYLLAMNYVSLYRTAAPATTTNEPTPQDYVSAQKGFQYLVSYTDGGFVPATLSVNKGETVRFTNNSGGILQLSLTGTAPLSQGQYFEYTFTTSGTVSDGGRNMVQVTVN